MFNDFKLSEETLKAIREKGFEKPTPIQEKAIPVLLEGKDLVGQAQTGTGKTAAFGIPVVERVNPKEGTIQALILVPTRELAIQVAKEIKDLGKHRRVKVLAVYGGKPIFGQIDLLKRIRPQVVVGTPGRVKDLIERGILDLSKVKVFVLDEADRMLDMGFIEDIEFIFSQTPEEKQTLLFSATLPPEIRDVIRRFLKEDHAEVRIEPEKPTVEKIRQKIYRVGDRKLFETFLAKLEETPFRKGIVFTQTKREADWLADRLKEAGFNAEAIHGDYSQNRREWVLRNFRKGNIDLLVATDVAARGLDIKGLDAVFNYRLPQDAESYIHRIGRTGRAGKEGLALSFSSDAEDDRLQRVKKLAGDTFEFVNLSDRPLERGKKNSKPRRGFGKGKYSSKRGFGRKRENFNSFGSRLRGDNPLGG
ncbi:MAG TPA: DEAD/DEAH box helicase [Aquifex sp.]|nr:DEAD/DEAH box helicase [Aquifex sp.]